MRVCKRRKGEEDLFESWGGRDSWEEWVIIVIKGMDYFKEKDGNLKEGAGVFFDGTFDSLGTIYLT